MRENNFSEYIRATEAEKYHKGFIWDTTIGLLEAEGQKPSQYLWETALRTVYGEITIKEAEQQINAYYDQETWRAKDRKTEQSDKLATKIAGVLSDPAFYFTPTQYIDIHKRLYDGIYSHAGKARTTDIKEKEWVLGGIEVTYGDAEVLLEALEYGMSLEMDYSYLNLPVDDAIKHIAQFFARLWQLHVFEEGNSITTALFLIKYLDFLGLDITDDVFAKNARCFENALVRANYNDEEKGIFATLSFLERFLRNLILKENNPLTNEEMLVTTEEKKNNDPINDPIKTTTRIDNNDPKKEDNDPIKTQSNFINEKPVLEVMENKAEKLSKREQSVYNLIKKDTRLTRNDMAKKLKCSEATIKRAVISLTQKGLIFREGSNKTGYWKAVS